MLIDDEVCTARREADDTDLAGVAHVIRVFVAAVPDNRRPPHLRFPSCRFLEDLEQCLSILTSSVVFHFGNEVLHAAAGCLGFCLSHVASSFRSTRILPASA